MVERHWPTNQKLRTEERPSPGLFNRAVDADRNEGRREGAKSQAGGKASFEHCGMDCSGDARGRRDFETRKNKATESNSRSRVSRSKTQYLDISCFN